MLKKPLKELTKSIKESVPRKKNCLPKKKAYGKPILNSIAVDAACSGNPGLMEYRGVATGTSTQLFIQGPYKSGTNNVGEFLALVHGLAWLQQKKQPTLPIYSDSRIAISWVRQRKCKTKLLSIRNRNIL